jgi:D-alanyl-lipoteichoic acid acyltransferase DltB (MBOAT superfamily)
LVHHRAWLWLTAIASSIFYAAWDWRFLFLLYYVALATWFAGERIHAARDDDERRGFVALSVVSCLLVLAIFKYFNFFVDGLTALSARLGVPISARFGEIVLPVAISFYTFHAISYTVDLYRRKLAKPSSLLDVLVYLSFFPQLVAGPIVRANRFLPQIARGPIFSARKIKLGVLLIAWGYFLKLCLADTAALVVDPIFAFPSSHGTGDLLFGLVGYSFQIYGDFAGYSLIAIGVAKLQGFDFPANFLAPYFSRSFSEFWQRWHISLSSFLRDYLFIPLGGNRSGKAKEYRNIFVTMFLGGLWHGASYNFALWGILHGIYLAAQRTVRSAVSFLPRPLGVWTRPPFANWITTSFKILVVYAFVLIAWLFFRMPSFGDALQYLFGILAMENAFDVQRKIMAVKVAMLIIATLSVDAWLINRRNLVRIRNNDTAIVMALTALIVTIELSGTFGGSAFIYFRF